MPMSRNNPNPPKNKPLAKKPSKVVRSRPSVATDNKKVTGQKARAQRDQGSADVKVSSGAIRKTSTEVLNLLKKNYPDAHCALIHRNAFELLVATILSAQCTDERVNQVTPVLFNRFPDPKSMASAPIGDLEQIVHSTGFYKNKAKNLKACASLLVQRYQGKVPAEMMALVELPGVGRKTANVVLGNVFGIASGVVVDTHVARLAFRLGWTKFEDPVQIERELSELFDSSEWILLSHLLISHGRACCQARRPSCFSCFLFDLCPRRGVK